MELSGSVSGLVLFFNKYSTGVWNLAICSRLHFDSKIDYERVNLTNGNTSIKLREVELKSQVLIKCRCFIVRF